MIKELKLTTKECTCLLFSFLLFCYCIYLGWFCPYSWNTFLHGLIIFLMGIFIFGYLMFRYGYRVGYRTDHCFGLRGMELFPRWLKFIIILLGSLSPNPDTRIKAARAWNNCFSDWGEITEDEIKQEADQILSKQHLKSSDK